MINFNFSKGYSLNFERKDICLKLIQFLKLLKIKQISFSKCLLISPYIFPLCQIIKKNRKRLQLFEFSPKSYQYFEIIKTNIVLLFLSISLCFNLKTLKFNNGREQEYNHAEFPKAFCLLNYLRNLEEIAFKGCGFYFSMESNSLQKLVSLKSISFKSCYFDVKAFFCLIENISYLPKMKKLILKKHNYFSDIIDFPEQNYLEKFIKNYRIPEISIDSCFEDEFEKFNFFNFFVNFLLQSKNCFIHILKLQISHAKLNLKIKELFQFLLGSNIDHLEINAWDYAPLDVQEFYYYLQNSQNLKTMKIFQGYSDMKWDLILNALSVNNSIKELSLSNGFCFDKYY